MQEKLGDIDQAAASPFTGLLFERPEPAPSAHEGQPEYFPDLHLDQLLDPMVDQWPEFSLAPLFETPLTSEDTVRYRQDVFRDLDDPAVLEAVEGFTEGMRTVRRRLAMAEKARYHHERERWIVDAVRVYRDATVAFADACRVLPLRSQALAAFREHLLAHVNGDRFRSLAGEADDVIAGLEGIRYDVTIKGTRVTVTPREEGTDFSDDVVATFSKFEHGPTKDFRTHIGSGLLLDHVEARILQLVARWFPEPFDALDRFVARWSEFVDPSVQRFDREIHFYLSYLSGIRPLTAAGLPFCYPDVSRTSKAISASGAFDIALAQKLTGETASVVGNDLFLAGDERVFVVTGPNQGGKTTFARMLGQLHHLGSLGCPVPGTGAQLFLPDRIFTHFEREEAIATLKGKLEDELVRVAGIFDRATSESLVIMNETFSSTSVADALFLGISVIERLTRLGALGVYVTFVDELATLNEATVSMVALVDPRDPAIRTFEVVRRTADGLAYAQAIADKHGLTEAALRRRLTR